MWKDLVDPTRIFPSQNDLSSGLSPPSQPLHCTPFSPSVRPTPPTSSLSKTTFPTADPLPADVEFRKVLAADQVSTFARFSTAWDSNVRLFTEFRGLDFCQARCAAMTECLGVFNFGSDEDKGFIDVCYGLSSLGVPGGAVTSRVCQSFFKFRPGSLGEPITVVSPFVDRNRPVSISDLMSADINGDDLRDVVAIGFSSAIYFLTQNEDGTFTQSKRQTSLRTFVTSALSFDLTGDGIEDLVYGSFFDNTLAYYPGSASGYTSQSTLIDDQSLSISAIASGSFSLSESDGFADLLALNFDESTDTSFVIVYTFGDQNEPTRTEAARLDDAGLRIASGDLDGDGRADAVYLTSSSLLWQSSGGNKVPFVGQPLQLLAMGTGNDVLVAELNGDERNDVVLLRNRNLIFFMNMGDGSLVRNASLSFGAQVGSVTVSAVDLTDDGSLDLVVGSRDFIITFENKGNFVFEELSRRTFATGTVTFATTGDLNSDGIQDVIVGSVLSGSSSSIVYYPNGRPEDYTEGYSSHPWLCISSKTLGPVVLLSLRPLYTTDHVSLRSTNFQPSNFIQLIPSRSHQPSRAGAFA